MSTTFIGVDLAWQGTKNHSGIAVASQNESGAILTALSDGITSFESAADFIDGHATANTVVAIDAPLVITNATGRRLCESLISRKFGKRHAGAHSSNLRLYPGGGPARLVGMLAERGFTHDFDIDRAGLREGRWIFEVYPHPAQVVLFDLPRIIRYKKGSTADKRLGLAILRRYLAETLPRSEPSLDPGEVGDSLLQQNLSTLAGMALKRHEDLLDAWFCTYLGLYLWRWGSERNEMLGDIGSGYIVVPIRSLRAPLSTPRSESADVLILAPGTRVVASGTVMITETGKQLPAGAVGVIGSLGSSAGHLMGSHPRSLNRNLDSRAWPLSGRFGPCPGPYLRSSAQSLRQLRFGLFPATGRDDQAAITLDERENRSAETVRWRSEHTITSADARLLMRRQ